MDPQATLNFLRDLIADEENDNIEAIREYFDALDNWMIGGGFLPRDWAANR